MSNHPQTGSPPLSQGNPNHATAANPPPIIVVTGDPICERNLAQLKGAPRDGAPSARLHPLFGGSVYLTKLIERICPADRFKIIGSELPSGESEKRILESDARIGKAFAIWNALPSEPVGNKSEDQVWRMAQDYLGYDAIDVEKLEKDVRASSEGASKSQQSRKRGLKNLYPVLRDPKAAERFDLLVIYDRGLGFCQIPKLWPQCLDADPKDPNKKDCQKDFQIVLKTSLRVIQQQKEGSLWQCLAEKHLNRLTVILSAASLRAGQVALSKGLSWEQTFEDLDHEFKTDPSLKMLARARRVVIHFTRVGAVVYQGGEFGGCGPELFVYHPDRLEGRWFGRREGKVAGATSILTAAIARHTVETMFGNTSYPLYNAVARALEAADTNHARGGGEIDKTKVPDTEVLDSFSGGRNLKEIGELLVPSDRSYPAGGFYQASRRFLCTPENLKRSLLLDVIGVGYERVVNEAKEVVQRGVDEVLKEVPKERYGKYLTVDREEIERLNEIRRLVTAYEANRAEDRPLSLAVFGPPGVGKSFAIKQLFRQLGELFPEDPLEFNLSQFDDQDDLHAAFHQVVSATVGGKIPLVFWDEFDAEALRWLKDFLAPMQDAAFRSSRVNYRLGKAIFVFAGGTCSTFREFDKSQDDGEAAALFGMKKGPDFVGRLRGYVNIKGPNPVAETGVSEEDAKERDIAHLVRRAILLRNFLGQHHPHLIEPATKKALVDENIIDAFLRVGRYRYGARSLEAIVKNSDLKDAIHFCPDALPSRELLKLHVRGEDFMGEIKRGEVSRIFESGQLRAA